MTAAAFLAPQHPLSKRLSGALEPSFLVLLTSATTFAASPLLFFLARRERGTARVLASWLAAVRLVAASVLSLASVSRYVAGLSATNASLSSMILNVAPLWAAGWMWILHGARPTRVFLACFAGCFCGLALASASVFGLPGEISAWSLLLVPVPAIYTLRLQLLHHWFPPSRQSAFEVSGAASVVSFAVVAAITLAWLTVAPPPLPESVPARWIFYFVLGTVSAGTVGAALQLTAIGRAGGDQGFVAAFGSVVPAFAAFFGIVLSAAEGNDGLDITPGQWAGISMVAASLIVLARSKRLPTSPA